jgi:hypothetical protein
MAVRGTVVHCLDIRSGVEEDSTAVGDTVVHHQYSGIRFGVEEGSMAVGNIAGLYWFWGYS